jgi:hypothetical protein
MRVKALVRNEKGKAVMDFKGIPEHRPSSESGSGSLGAGGSSITGCSLYRSSASRK